MTAGLRNGRKQEEIMQQESQESFFPEGSLILPSTYKQKAYQLIKDAILYRRLQVGTVYSQDGLCAELGISRTPVREALLELQKEGYIKILRGRGIEVVPVSHKEAEDIIEMRLIIELAGSELAAKRASDSQLKRLRENLEEMEQQMETADNSILYRHDRQFHILIFEASGNNRLLDTVENLRDLFLRLETLEAFQDAKGREQVVSEHRKIYEALEKHEPELARQAMKEHLEETYARTVRPVIDKLP